MADFHQALNYARQALSAGRLAEAAPVYQQLLQAAPQRGDLWHEMGVLQLQAGNLQVAAECLARAVSLEPANPAFLSNWGVTLRQLKRPNEAAEAFQRAIQAGAQSPQLWNNLALAHKDAGDTPAALEAFNRALGLKSDYGTAHFNRANLLLNEGRLDEAIAGYQQAIELDPRDAGAWCKLGVAHFDQADMASAVRCFDRALAIQPDYAEARRNRAMAWLAQGDYARGWAEAEHRLRCEGFVPRITEGPRWQGVPLAGRTLLVHAEQGLGDTLQFVRYVPLLEALGGSVLLDVQPPLLALLRQSGFDRWLVPPGVVPTYDLQCPLMSLPRFVPDPSGRPCWNGPYLVSGSDRVEIWREWLRDYDRLRVGLVWAGNPDHPHDRFRSLPLRALAPLSEVPGVQFVSLQKGPGSEQIRAADAPSGIIEPTAPWDEPTPLLDTAAILENLDLLISVDTSIAHLAGAMGRPVWLLLQYSADWRWQLQGESTTWYPSMRLFRQDALHDWRGAILRVKSELAALAERSSSAPNS